MFGTDSLRKSKDPYNQELSFSVVIRDLTNTQGFTTLDIECETMDAYFFLLKGFSLLQPYGRDMTPRGSRNKNKKETYSVVAELWLGVKRQFSKTTRVRDPIESLFDQNITIDPLRAMRVDGGRGLLNEVGGGMTALVLRESPSKSPHSAKERTGLTTTTKGLTAGSDGKPYIHAPLARVPPARFLGWTSAGTQIWARLKMAGLDVKCVFSWDLKRVILKIRCPPWRLEEMAELMHLKIKSRTGAPVL